MLANESIKTRQLPDKSLLFAILAMIMFGWIMSFSASLAHFNSHNWFIKQTIFISTGLILGLLVLKIPISLFKKVSVPLFILTLILLAMVFLPSPIGVNVNGSYRWISFGFFNFQPSELMKLAMILYMAGFLIRQEKDVRRPWMGFLKTILIVSAADILLLLEMDIGATLIITLTAIAMLFAAGSYLAQLGIVVSAWNKEITSNLLKGSKDTLMDCGASSMDIITMDVPGSFELIYGAKIMAKKKVDVIICLGSIVQGETKHFDFVCNAVSIGIKDLNIALNIPVVFGVLTDNNLQQAKNRSGGKHGNKGVEAAITAIKMAHLNK